MCVTPLVLEIQHLVVSSAGTCLMPLSERRALSLNTFGFESDRRHVDL